MHKKLIIINKHIVTIGNKRVIHQVNDTHHIKLSSRFELNYNFLKPVDAKIQDHKNML